MVFHAVVMKRLVIGAGLPDGVFGFAGIRVHPCASVAKLRHSPALAQVGEAESDATPLSCAANVGECGFE
jgi:hypothetical protein